MKRLLAVLAAICMIVPATVEAFPAKVPDDITLPSEGIAVSRDELICLALNDYFEARGESLRGRVAVAQVVLNRARDERFPRDLCQVITQNLSAEQHLCQFSWTCDGLPDEPREEASWRQSLLLAVAVLRVTNGIDDPTGGALWYHADHVSPDWATRLQQTASIGAHAFYTDRPTFEEGEVPPTTDLQLAAFGGAAIVVAEGPEIAPPPLTFAEWVEMTRAPEQIAQR